MFMYVFDFGSMLLGLGFILATVAQGPEKNVFQDECPWYNPATNLTTVAQGPGNLYVYVFF